MSVTIKSKSDIQKLREAGRIAANALVHAGKVIHPGMTTKQLDKSIHDFIVGCGAVPTFLGYGGFPASACISINDEIIHGIPSHKRVIREGDIVSVDVGATFNGFVGDTAYTFAVGRSQPLRCDRCGKGRGTPRRCVPYRGRILRFPWVRYCTGILRTRNRP